MRNKDIPHHWRIGVNAKCANYHTDGKNLYSYQLKIGETINGEKILYDYTRSGEYYSQTTSRHVGLAKCYADRLEGPKC